MIQATLGLKSEQIEWKLHALWCLRCAALFLYLLAESTSSARQRRKRCHLTAMASTSIPPTFNVKKELEKVTEFWSPRVVAQVSLAREAGAAAPGENS